MIFRKALFSAILTILSFVLFVGVYLFVTVGAIEPYYLEGLIFALPFICFGIIAILTAKEILGGVTSFILTILLTFLLSFLMFFAITFISIDAATTVTTDLNKYERVLKLKGYPDESLTKYFPEEIPDNAENILFSYNPAFVQGGENLSLKFEVDSEYISKYINEILPNVKWKGKSNDSEAESLGIFSSTFQPFGYRELPKDYTIYIMESRPYRANDWNHGRLSLIAINNERNVMIFLAENW